jgi:hypothetical protein
MIKMVRLRITYERYAELRQDLDGQLTHGGILVQSAPPPGLEFQARVSLEIVVPDGRSVRGEGVVLHLHGSGQPGIAVTFPPKQVEALRSLLAGAGPDPQEARASRHEVVPEGQEDPHGEAPGASEAQTPAQQTPTRQAAERRLLELSSAEKIQVALHGSAEERTAILRDRNKMLHPYVLRNPQISPEEVLAIAKNPLTGAELLQIIAGNKDWVQRPAIALALVRNPKTPQGSGLRALDFVHPVELRQIAKVANAPPHIVQAARKKVL